MIPEKVVVDFVYLCSRVEHFARQVWDHDEGGSSRRHYWMPVYEHAQRVTQRANLIAVTGHSLGGSIAQIVGAKLAVPGVGFSSPGIVMSHKKFAVSRKAIDAYGTNVITSNDVIPKIDRQGGTLYNLQCEYSRGDLCHSIELHLTRIVAMCPNIRENLLMNGTVTIKPQFYEGLWKYLSGWDWGSDEDSMKNSTN